MNYAAYEYKKTPPVNAKKKKIIAFGWYGGKYSHLNWLLPLLPYTRHYCEPFGGSAAVLLNRKPSEVETYNIAHKVIVPFDKKNYNVLGGSAEPYVNNPLRCVSVTSENEARQKNKGFISRIGPELDRGNSSILHRKTWANLLREI